MSDRIPCFVPHCRRSAPRNRYPDSTEMFAVIEKGRLPVKEAAQVKGGNAQRRAAAARRPKPLAYRTAASIAHPAAIVSRDQ